MSQISSKVFNGILQFSILVFAVVLVWFSAVYYPKVLGEVKSAPVTKKPLIATVEAAAATFPYENNFFRINYRDSLKSFYVFVKGNNLEQFAVNKNRADLFLKTSLSLDSLCQTNVIYVSVARLKVPIDYLLSNCNK